GTAVAAQIHLLLGCRKLRSVLRIEADAEYFEILPRVERNTFQAALHAVEDERAEHRALVINQGQNDGLLTAEEGGKRYGTPGFVAKSEIERNLPVEFLVDAHGGQRRGESGTDARILQVVGRQCRSQLPRLRPCGAGCR